MFDIPHEKMLALIDVYASIEASVNDSIVLDKSRDDEGREHHVIRDALAEPGRRVLWKEPVNIERGSLGEAEAKLDYFHRRRVVLAIIAAHAST